MGRQLRRVPIDFDWPIGETWKGFINPHYGACHDCEACEGSGYSPEAKHLQDKWYGKVDFDPSEKGSEPFTINSPAIRTFAERQCERSPEFYGSGKMAILWEAQRMSSLMNQS